MDKSLILLTVVTASALAAVIVWSIYRQNLPPDVAAFLSESVVRLRAQLSAHDSESLIRLWAGELYDVLVEEGNPGTAKISEEFFVDWCVRIILGAQEKGNADAAVFAGYR